MTSDATSRLNAALEGRYRIDLKLGEGGMATVYLAADLRHERKVALKVLKPELAAVVGAERFLGEIKTTANLQHPHILPLFDSGEADGFLFYVMPYVEGESLRNRLDREHQLAVDEAVRVATNVAEALDYAHRQGVVHRDIKPANILLQDGKPVVADFGISLAVTTAGGGRLTETGLSLGTPHYMSPEQATGDRIPDARSDLYALGCVLYEMLVGEPPFTGGSAQAVLGKIITAPAPAVGDQRRGVPPQVEGTILWALEKLPADRVDSGKTFADALSGGVTVPVGSSGTSKSAPAVRWRERVVWSTAVAMAGVAGAALFRTPSNQETRRLDLALTDSIPMAFIGEAALGNGRRAFDLTDDGSMLVYVGVRQGVPRLYKRSLDDYQVEELPGTEGAYGPFFAPGGTQVAFFVGNELRKVRVEGGAVVTIAQVPNPVGGDWTPTGEIVFAGSEGRMLGRVSDQGGVVDTLAVSRDDEFYWPQVLPGGERVLGSGFLKMVSVTNLATGVRRVLKVPQAGQATYLATGHLALMRGSVLHVARFDVEALEVTSPFVPVQSGVRSEIYGRGQWDVADDGTLVYAEGWSVTENELRWVAPGAEARSLGLRTAYRGSFELSPDGRRLAVVEEDASGSHVVVYDLDSRRPQRLSSEPGAYGPLAWSPDGLEVMYMSLLRRDEAHEWQALIRPVNGGDPRPIPTDRTSAFGFSWSVTGQIGIGRQDGLALASIATGEERPIPGTDGTSWGVVLSPAGDLIAYTSEGAGEYHNYVQPNPPTGEIVQVSLVGGAEEPRWSADGKRLYYRSGQRIMYVPVDRGPPLSAGTPQVFWEGDFVNVGGRSYDVSADGQWALIIDGGVGTTTRLRVIQGWLAEVERLIDEAAGSGP